MTPTPHVAEPVAVPRVAIGPAVPSAMREAVTSGGGLVVDVGEPADGLVWLDPRDLDGLGRALGATEGLRWVQLPLAGVDRFVVQPVFTDRYVWTSAKGVFAEPVAEHALALALAGLRELPTRLRATSWGPEGATTLFDRDVTIVGAGGIARSLLALLAPFRCRITIVRKHDGPVEGAHRVVTFDRFHEALPEALVVVVAAALTPETTGLIGAAELAAMAPDAWLVNVGRGAHVVTDALVDALRAGVIGGAALDVTDPEPLPDGHPLWTMDNCIITPHTANTLALGAPLLAGRVRRNVALLAAGRPLEGVIDVASGY